MKQGIRTDLAVEIRESMEQEGEIPGVEWQMEDDAKSGARISKVERVILVGNVGNHVRFGVSVEVTRHDDGQAAC